MDFETVLGLTDTGIQRLAPAKVDPGMDLHEEFAKALSLYHSEKER